MKVNATPFVYSGTCDGLVYYYNSKLKTMVARKYVYPKLTKQNHRLGQINKNLSLIVPSEGYIDDLRAYIAFLQFKGAHKNMVNWRCVVLSMFFAMEKLYPSIDIANITKQQMYDNNLPCTSVKAAIEAGLLAEVKGYETLTHQI